MTPTDITAFEAAFQRLLVTTKHSYAKLSTREMAMVRSVFADSLSDYSIEAIEVAERKLRTEGSGWFPTAPEWSDAAAEAEVALEEARPIPRALPPASVVIAQDLKRLEKARTKFVADCRKSGFDGVARFFEQLELKHISTMGDPPFCLECADVGVVLDVTDTERKVKACACVPDNPQIRRRRVVQRRLSMLAGRRKRASQLNPGDRSLQGL